MIEYLIIPLKLISFILVAIPKELSSAGCSVRVNELNCNTAIIKDGQLLTGEAFIELHWICKGQKIEKRSADLLTDYHLVIWDRVAFTSRLVLPLSAMDATANFITLSQDNFTAHGFYNYSQIRTCPFDHTMGTIDNNCEQWLPADSFKGLFR